MPSTLRRATRALSVFAVFSLLALPATPLAAQIAVPVYLQGGIPQGEFAADVSFAGGLGGGLLWVIGPEVAIRGDLGFMVYGNERRRVPLGGGALGLITVDVSTTNSIAAGGIGLQIGTPSRRIKPYVGGMIGFSAFTTTSQVEGLNSDDQPFARSTNSSDNVFAKTALAGLYLPIGSGNTVLDIGVRHTWNGEQVRYLTPADVVEDANGDIVLTPRETRADLLTITIGLTFRPGGKR